MESVDETIPQSTFWRLKDNKFNIHLDAGKFALLEKLSRLPALDTVYEAHEGIHSGNIRAKLFLDEKRNRFCKKLIFGRDEIGRYFLHWNGGWVNYHAGVMDHAK